MKNYLFVTTIPSIYYLAFPLLKKLEGETYIIATTKQVEYFFKQFTDCKVIPMKVDRNFCSKSKKLKSIHNIIAVRREYKKLFSNIKDSNIYFFGSSWSLTVFYYAKRLAEHNKVYKHELDLHSFVKKEKGIKTFFLKSAIKISLGIDVDVKKGGNITSFQLNENFFIKNGIEKKLVSSPELSKEHLKIDMLKGKQLLYILDSSSAVKQIAKEDYMYTTNRVCTILNKYFPNKYVLKPHYNMNTVYEPVATKALLPPYVPLEFCLDYPIKVVIGTASLGLAAAKKIYKKKVISLVYLFNYKDKDIQRSYVDWLQKESKGILYPKTFEELEGMLK